MKTRKVDAMKSFQGEVSKQELLDVLEKHAEADNFIQGLYWENGKGCALGCSLEHFTEDVENHAEKAEELFFVPAVLFELEYKVFENLSFEDSKWWPVAFTDAIPENVDLKYVWPKFCIWMLREMEQYISNEVIERTIHVYEVFIDTGEFDAADAVAVADSASASASAAVAAVASAASAAVAAHAAVAAAADAAAYVAVVDAVDAAAAASAASADAAAYAYAVDDAHAVDAAEKRTYTKKQADKLIEILRNESGEFTEVKL